MSLISQHGQPMPTALHLPHAQQLRQGGGIADPPDGIYCLDAMVSPRSQHLGGARVVEAIHPVCMPTQKMSLKGEIAWRRARVIAVGRRRDECLAFA